MRDFITKGEISKLLGVEKSQVRFYEKKGLLSPEIDDNNYAKYTFKEINNLDVILFLREIDTPIDKVKEIVVNEGGYDYLEILKDADTKLQNEIKALQKKRKNIKRRIALFEERDIENFIIKTFKERTIFLSDEDFGYVSAKKAFELTQKYHIDFRDLDNELCHIIKHDKTITGLITSKQKKIKNSIKSSIPAGKYLSYSFYFKNQDELKEKRNIFKKQVDASEYVFAEETYFIDHFAQTYYNYGQFVVTLQKRIID